MNTVKKFRLAVVRYSLIVTVILAGVAHYFFDPVIGQGIFIGALAATIGFWIFAIKMEKLASLAEDAVQSHVLRWSAIRYALFGAALYKGHTLDPESMGGFLGAVIGIFIIRFVTIFLGITGFDLKEEQS